MENPYVSIFWFRRDLRLEDNVGLFHALEEDLPVIPIFIFDKLILEDLEKDDPRVNFIHESLHNLNVELKQSNASLDVFHNTPLDAWKSIIKKYNVKKVFFNRDYEPYAICRDEEVIDFLEKKNIECFHYKDHVIFEKNEILKADGKPYMVFTPYSRAWKSKQEQGSTKKYSSNLKNMSKNDLSNFSSLHDIGFKKSSINFPEPRLDIETITSYKNKRDFPSLNGTSRVGIFLRFGIISIRQLLIHTKPLSDVFVNEIIWREFYQMVLYQFPRVVTENFNSKYERIKWRNNEKDFVTWCMGNTGFPIVDAGMRELNLTGFMHNRVRMITASFLSKHLLIDWRWGEAYFASKLLDYELASNNGGWQWAAGTGVDAAPYFRIFNPMIQEKKFDPDKKYIKKWIPEYGTKEYPKPMVDHKFARERALKEYKSALEQQDVYWIKK